MYDTSLDLNLRWGWNGEQKNRMLLGQFGKSECELYMKSGLLRIECTHKSLQGTS